MLARDLSAMTIELLVWRFVEIAVRQDECLLANEVAKYNRLFRQIQEIVQELKSRPGDQRRALMDLYDHPNMQARVKAAKATLAVAYGPARAVLEAIRDSGWQPQALDAGMCIRNLDNGVFVPS